jgi:serine/threonine-protein kinase
MSAGAAGGGGTGGHPLDRHELWLQADALFEELLSLDPDERVGALASFAGPPEVAARVRRLLELEDESREFLNQDSIPIPEGALAEVESRTRPSLPEGTRVGRYAVAGVLGRGGTSTVYRARRADGAFDQEIALKVVRSDMRADELARRMRAERQILATLSHPNLARVFDGGVTDDGRPWLGVELVEGERVDRWADARALPIRERLRLFLQILAAVQHAHQNLIVHRDLKPSNILVTDDGVAKLLDFGIAKLLSPDNVAAGWDETQLGDGQWVTPSYAAPEQLLGQRITTATDIHALGVILYELLTGHRPFADTGSTRFAVERAICETEAPSPSSTVTGAAPANTDTEATARNRATTPPELRRTLGGDLDAIVLKALRKEPERRYASADEFARDIRRYLDGLPVEARGDSAGYRARKFVRRNRVPVAAAALLVLTLSGSAVSLGLSRSAVLKERDRAEDAAARAEAEAENAQAVIAFLADVFRGRDPNAAPSDTVTALELVEWGKERVTSEFEDQPAVKGQLLSVLSEAYLNLGFPEQGVELARAGLTSAESSFGGGSREFAEARLDLASVMRRARVAEDTALFHAREALGLMQSLDGDSSITLVPALSEVAILFNMQLFGDSAAAYMDRSIRIQRAAGRSPADMSRTLLELAQVRRQQGRYTEAIALYSEAVPEYRRRFGDDYRGLAAHLNNMAFAHKEAGDLVAADTLYREALALGSEAFGRGHPNMVQVAMNLAGTLAQQGRYPAADSVLATSLDQLRQRWPENHWRVGQGLSNRGTFRLRAGDPVGALPLLERAADNYRNALGVDHYWTVFAEADVGIARTVLARKGGPAGDNGTGGSPELDRAYALVRSWYEAGGIRPDGINVITPMIDLMRSVDLEDEAERFSALVDPQN